MIVCFHFRRLEGYCDLSQVLPVHVAGTTDTLARNPASQTFWSK